jgi:hypothetical protein
MVVQSRRRSRVAMRLNTPEYSEQEPAEGAVGEESEEEAEVGEAVEEVTTSGDGEDEAMEVDTRDVNTEVGEEGEASPEARGKALDGSVDMASDDVEEEVVEVKSGEGSELAAVSVPPVNGEVKSHEALEAAPPVEEDATTGGEPEIESSTSEEVNASVRNRGAGATSAPLSPPGEIRFEVLKGTLIYFVCCSQKLLWEGDCIGQRRDLDCWGALHVPPLAERYGSRIPAADSEHSAVSQVRPPTAPMSPSL